MSVDPACGKCRHWKADEGTNAEVGECRRSPPQEGFGAGLRRSPADYWCGEFELRPEPPQPEPQLAAEDLTFDKFWWTEDQTLGGHATSQQAAQAWLDRHVVGTPEGFDVSVRVHRRRRPMPAEWVACWAHGILSAIAEHEDHHAAAPLGTGQQQKELTADVRAVVASWLDRNGLRPRHLVVDTEIWGVCDDGTPTRLAPRCR